MRDATRGGLGTVISELVRGKDYGLQIIEENLVENSASVGAYLIEKLGAFDNIQEVRGKGLMVGIEMDSAIKELRKHILHTHKIFTGSAKNPNVLRILPPLTIQQEHIDTFLSAFQQTTESEMVNHK